MGPLELKFNFRDIFRSPRIALSGKKIFIFIQGNLLGFILYWIFSYLSLALTGLSIQESIGKYGLYPCLFGNNAEWYSYLIYFIGIEAWILAICFASTAVSRVSLKQMKGNDFYSSGEAWTYVFKHWHAVAFSPVALALIIFFFIFSAALFGLISTIPYLGEFFFVVPYLLYFLGSIFTTYTLLVFIISFIYTPPIVGVYEEDTMGTIFQSYSITFGQNWRIIIYHILLLPLIALGLEIFSWFCFNAIGLINYIFGCSWFMGEKLTNITNYASSLVYPVWMTEMLYSIKDCLLDCFGLTYNIPYFFQPFSDTYNAIDITPTESIAGVVLALFYFIIGLSIISYGFSILTVGETLMFIIFKKISDNDNLLLRKDEDEIDEELNDDYDDDLGDISESPDITKKTDEDSGNQNYSEEE